jgi:phosphoglucosamine mutase
MSLPPASRPGGVFMDKLFGTDGIRGVAGEFPLDERTVAVIGASLAKHLSAELGRAPRLVTGRDTRESGEWIERAFHSGAVSAGAVCASAGVITTPGVAYITQAFNFDAGIVISASHNPYQDNGIKMFSPSGKKLTAEYETRIEAEIYAKKDGEFKPLELDISRSGEFHEAYVAHLLEIAGGFSAAGKKIVIDCANGAACAFASELFAALGAQVIVIHDQPDGRNINEKCGSTDLEHLVRDGGFSASLLRTTVLEHSADLGIAFDGDADRVLFVDEHGNFVDGDATLWVMARYLKSHDKLANSTVVATVMSNIGLELALGTESVDLLRTDVGDKYVLSELINTRSSIGGEQSGHIIFPEVSLVGDGIMTAMLVLKAITEKGVSLSQAAEGFTRFPQTLLNVPVKTKPRFEDVPQIAAAAAEIEGELHGEGRLLLRYSGTQGLARVMIEGKDQAAIEGQARRLAAVIDSALN